MNTIQSAGSQDMGSNILSPEAKEFVPRQFPGAPACDGQNGLLPVPDANLLGQRAVTSVPQYLTTCYPFVPGSADHRFGRPRYRGKVPQMFVPPHFQAVHQGAPRNRFPFPGKHFLPPASWVPGIPDVRGPFQNVPNGMPFDGGTGYQNGFIPNVGMPPMMNVRPMYPPVPYGGSHVAKEIVNGGSVTMNGHVDPPIAAMNHLLPNGLSSSLSSDDMNHVCFKNSSVQTDFPDQLAKSTLEDVPNSLFNTPRPYTHRSRHKTRSRSSNSTSNTGDSDSDVGSDSGYSGALKRNHCGTNPGLDLSSSAEHHKSMQYTSVIRGQSSFNEGVVEGNGGSLGFDIDSMQGGCDQVPYSSVDGSVTHSATLSYAAVAQSKLSQAWKPKSDEQVSTATSGAGDQRSRKIVEPVGLGPGKKNVKGGVSSRLGGINVNVAQLMADLDRADKLQTDGQSHKNCVKEKHPKVTSTHNVSYLAHDASKMSWAANHKKTTVLGSPQFNYSSVVKNNSNIPATHSVSYVPPGSQPVSTVATLSGSSSSHSQTVLSTGGKNYQAGQVWAQKVEVQGHVVKDHTRGQGHGVNDHSQGYGHQINDHNRSNSSQVNGQGVPQGPKSPRSRSHDSNYASADGLVANVTNGGQPEGEGKKKRRRRRRRKRGGEEGEVNNDGISEEEVALHFEDDEEFPDLATSVSTNQNCAASGGNFSYSAALKNTGPVVPVEAPAEPQPHSQPARCLVDEFLDKEGLVNPEGEDTKESRNSRKRRKRRETANKAADAEMAEINLEQHMLELKMKQKMPVSSKKSVSPQRAASTQGVWKLPPTSTAPPSSSGKKVSLLLPGTVATETSHASSPSTPSATTTKQHGILKTSQPVSQPNQGGKKSKQPITYDLGALIDALEFKKEQPAPPKKEVKPPVVKKEESKSHNLLDSSAPAKRGKEREVPKCKKPSPLKKVILKEREEKKWLRLLDDDETATSMPQPPQLSASPVSAPVGIGVLNEDSDLSQDASSSKGSMEVAGLGTPASAELSPISQQSPSCMSPMSPGASPISSGLNSPVTGTISQTVKLKIHSRRFREYCNQVLDKEIDNSVTALLTDLVRFQDKQYHKDPIRAKSKRRFVLGLREVTKHLKLKKIKSVIISPNLEKIQSKGGLDDALNLILELCNEQSIPFIFALGRRALGRACAKLVPVSVVGIFNYEGSEVNFKNLVSLTEKAREAYREMISQIEKEIAEYPIRTSAPGIPTLFSHMGHSRTPSGCSVISFTSSILSEPISENYPQSEPETDNRGYEIEQKPDGADVADLVEVTMDGRQDIGNVDVALADVSDPYEADDESNAYTSTSRKCSGKQQGKSMRSGSDRKTGDSSCDKVDITKVCDGHNVCSVDDEPDKLLVNGNQTEADSTTQSLVGLRNGHVDAGSASKADADRGGTVKEQGGNDEKYAESDSSEEDFEDDAEDEEEDDAEVEDADDDNHYSKEKTTNEEDEKSDDDKDFNTCDEGVSDDSDSDDEHLGEDVDRLVELPQFIDSVHHFDLNEILSQHSSKTIENGEDVMSTHSSRTTHSSKTLGEAAVSIEWQTGKVMEMKSADYPTSVTQLKGKTCIDKEDRTLTWVKEAQNLHFTDKMDSEHEEDFTVNGFVSSDKCDSHEK